MSSRRSRPSHVVRALALLAPILGGCGLVLDLDPADPLQRVRRDAGDGGAMDGGAMDGGAMDGGAMDGGAMDAGARDGSFDAGPRDPCTGQSDGIECEPLTPGEGRFICLTGTCVASRCGDAFVDLEAGEECDDGNAVGGDGCEPVTCRPGCSTEVDCDDSVECTTEACTAGVCERALADGACEEASGEVRVCFAGRCVLEGCGDGTLDGGEECDDGNRDDGDGCDGDCTWPCTTSVDCDDGDRCNGIETCDPEAHGCSAGLPPACAASPCETSICDRSRGCVVSLIDSDGDGYAPQSLGACGTDCDDGDPTVHAGAPELCDGRDNDCDGRVDDDVVTVACYADTDLDGYGSPVAPVSDCTCPSGRVSIGGDCWDGPGESAELVHPAQLAYSERPYCVTGTDCRFDYDCNGVSEHRWPAPGTSCRKDGLLSSCSGGGWVGAVPACGVTGTWRTCGSLLGLICRYSDAPRVQQCR